MASILVVENRQQSCDLLSDILAQSYEVRAVLSAEEALALLERRGFEAVITEFSLARMKGTDLLDLLSQRYPALPVIVATGGDAARIADEMLHRGAFGVLQKPYMAGEVSGLLRRAVSGRRCADEAGATSLTEQRRRHPRARVSIEVDWDMGTRNIYRGRMTSLSIGGCFIRTDVLALRGQSVSVRFWLGPDGQSVLRGRVAYNLENVGLGVEFFGLDEEERQSLGSLVEHYLYEDRLRQNA